MKNFTLNWQAAFISNEELIFSIQTLLAIQQNNLSDMKIPCDFFYYLSDYAKELNKIETQPVKFRYYINIDVNRNYDATDNATDIILFTQAWAKKLLASRYLDNPALFFCKVIAGEITNPDGYYQANKAALPTITQFINNINEHNNRLFIEKRDAPCGTASIIIGSWFPTANLKTLGNHPSVGAQFGYRTKLNEYDFTFIYRFLSPTPRSYSFIQQDTLVTSNYYDGGYIGLDYTRYLIHKKYFDAGVTSGIGYDGFDMGNSSDVYPSPGSLNFNNGIRLKYFFHTSSFIGAAIKYNLIHYSNPGGTNLNGNAFSIDLSYGWH